MATTSRDKSKRVSVSGPALIPAGELSGKPPIPLTRPIIVIGSRETSRIHLISRTVSKSHALLVVTRHTVFIRDLCSREGTFVNGERVGERDLSDGDILKIGRFEFIFTAGGAHLRPHREKPPTPGVIAPVLGDAPPVPLENRVTLIGRKQNADIPFLESVVSAAHAVIVAWEGRRYIRDLGSRTGTFVNGKQVHQQELRPLDQIRIGETDLVYEVSTEGAGVDVVASPTESAVSKAVAAQELPPVETGSDTVALDQPTIEEPATRTVGRSTAAGPAPRARPVAPAPVEPLPLELADSVAGEASPETLPLDDAAGASHTGLDDLPRRGWHRTGNGEESASEALPVDDSPVEQLPVEPLSVEPIPVAETAVDQPVVDESPVAIPPVSAGPADAARVETSPADAPIVDAEPVAPLQPEALPASETPEPLEFSPATDAALAPPDLLLEEAAAEAEAALTTVETTISAEASLDDLPPADNLNPVDAVEPLSIEPTSPASGAPVAEPVVEVLEAVEPTPESAQPLVDNELNDIAPMPDPAETVATVNLDAGAPGAELAVDTLTDTAFSREVSSLTDSRLGELVVVETTSPTAAPVEPPQVELLQVVTDENPGLEVPPLDRATPEPVPLASMELGAPPSPVEAPTPPADLSADAPELDLSPVVETAVVLPVDPPAGPPSDRRGYVEPTLPLTAPDASVLAEDLHATEAEIEPLPAVGATMSVADVADTTPLVAPIQAVEPLVEPVLPDPTPVPEPPAEAVAQVAVEPVQATINLPPEPASPPETVALPEPPPSPALETEPLAPTAPADMPPTGEAGGFTGDLVEVPLDTSAETAFAVVVPPLDETPVDLGLAPDAPDAAAVPAVDEAVPPLHEPPSAPAPASNVAHDLGPAALPVSPEGPAVAIAPPPTDFDPAGGHTDIGATISLPPPLPPDAPPLTAASEDETPNILIPPTPRRPVLIRDGFNRRGTRPPGPEMPADAPAPSPFAGARGRSGVPTLGEAIDPFGETATPEGEPVVTPMDLVRPDEPTPAERPVRPRPVRQGIQPRPTFANAGAPALGATVEGLSPAPGQPATLTAAGDDDDADIDLHALRARRLRRIPTLLLTGLLLALLSAGAIWQFVPVYSNFETSVKFDNFQALSIVEQKNLQDEQRRLLRTSLFRVNAAKILRSQHPEVSPGFLDSPLSFERTIQQAYWREGNPAEFVLRHVGREDGDRLRLHAMATAVFAENQGKADAARRVRAAVKDLDEKVQAHARKLADLKQQIERERMLGESRPTPTQLSLLQSEATLLESTWNDALARLKDAEAEQQRLERALLAARENPAPPPESDEALKKLEQELTDLKARHQALLSAQSPQTASAREELDAAMEAFSRQIEAARGQGVESPELANYIAAAESLQKTTRELLDDLIARQQKQQQRLAELKARLDEQARKRIAELRAGDAQLRELTDRREILRRQVNAATGSDGGVPPEELATARENLRLVENLIKSREEVLASDPLYAEALASLQSIIDQTEADIAADRKRADERLDELQKSLAASSPAVAGLPEEQKKLTREIQAQLAAVAEARRRYADVADLDRQSADAQLRQLQDRIATLQTDVDARRKQLAEDYASRSVAALTASLENHGKLLADAREVESTARAAFEEKSRALRAARDALAAGDASDDRLNRLINERQETEALLSTFNDQLQFKRQELRTVVDILPPAEQDVKVMRGEDLRPRYILVAVGSILACLAGLTWWTIHGANRLEYAVRAPAGAGAPAPGGQAEASVASGTAAAAPVGARRGDVGAVSDDPPEHATVA